jgi:hypothetical protein
MKGLRFLKGAAVSLACWGFIVPQADLLAAGPKQDVKTGQTVKAPQVADVALTAGGTVAGKVVDAQGKGVDGAVVSVVYGKTEVAKTVTDKDGNYSVKNLRGGVHAIVAGQQAKLFRFWAADTAPPQTRDLALIVSSKGTVRGQSCCGEGGLLNATNLCCLATLGVGIATLVVAAESNSNASDAKKYAKAADKKAQQALDAIANASP